MEIRVNNKVVELYPIALTRIRKLLLEDVDMLSSIEKASAILVISLYKEDDKNKVFVYWASENINDVIAMIEYAKQKILEDE